jgi:broad specificity phosphatase PhoE
MTTSYCTIYLVRHGETENNISHLIQGQRDSPLTVNGIQQAQDLATQLRSVHFSAIYSSDLLRAQKTAEYIAIDKQLTVTTTKLLRERYFGRFEGKPWQIFQQKLEKLLAENQALTGTKNLFHRIDPSVETDDAIAQRAIRFLRQVALVHPNQSILVVSHGGTMRAILLHLGVFAEKDLQAITIENTAYAVIRSDGTDFFIDQTVGIGIFP